MTNHSIAMSADTYRRFGVAQRVFTLASVVPSQDASRYQAQNMPPPTYDLARTKDPTSRLTVLFRALVLLAVDGALILLRRSTTLLQA